jgi:hypothetical protein
MARNKDIKANFIAWYKEVLGFNDDVARALYDEQLLKDKKALTELSDSEIDSIIRAIRWTLPIAEISVARLKLAIFWIRHQDRTQCKVGITSNPLVKTELKMMLLLKTQKQLEDKWCLGNKEPDYPAQTLDMASATKTFDKTRTLLSRVHGVTGIPLSYVMRGILKVKAAVDDHAFGETDLEYTAIDLELIMRAPILSSDADSSNNNEKLETNGPFHVFPWPWAWCPGNSINILKQTRVILLKYPI